MCARDDVQTRRKLDSALSCSVNVEVCGSGHVVIGCAHRAVSPRNHGQL